MGPRFRGDDERGNGNNEENMTDLTNLKTTLLAQVDAAQTLDAVESLRVHALGKQGEITALLKTLGKMTPEERQAAAREMLDQVFGREPSSESAAK